MKKLGILLVAPLLLLAADAPRASLVQTAPVEKAEVKSLQSFVGSVSFEQSAKVASEGSGSVISVNFKEGDKVEKNQILNTLDTQILDAQIASAKAQLAQTLVSVKKAKKDLNRYEKLIAQDAVSQSIYEDNLFNVESLENSISSLQANIKAQEIQKRKKITTAPFDGVIISKNIELGDWVQQGGVVAELVNPKSAQVEVSLPQNVVQMLKPKMDMQVTIGNKSYSAYVRAIVPKGDIATRTFPVKLSFKQVPAGLLEGMAAEVQIQSGRDVQALIVPRDAVIKRFGQDVVFFDAKGTAAMVPVQIVGYTNGKVAVNAKGLSEGMRVVTKGNERIFPKSPIKDISGVK